MRTHRAYLFGVGLALPILALVAGLQVQSVSASPQKITTQKSTTQKSTIDVNRTLKGDRLIPAADSESAEQQGLQAPTRPRLPDGCESTVSAMTRSSLAQTPGRCIS
jgi:hypothetical protein